LSEVKSYSLAHFVALPYMPTQRDEENPGVYPRKSSMRMPAECGMMQKYFSGMIAGEGGE
jgi:hypothetical protein